MMSQSIDPTPSDPKKTSGSNNASESKKKVTSKTVDKAPKSTSKVAPAKKVTSKKKAESIAPVDNKPDTKKTAKKTTEQVAKKPIAKNTAKKTTEPKVKKSAPKSVTTEENAATVKKVSEKKSAPVAEKATAATKKTVEKPAASKKAASKAADAEKKTSEKKTATTKKTTAKSASSKKATSKAVGAEKKTSEKATATTKKTVEKPAASKKAASKAVDAEKKTSEKKAAKSKSESPKKLSELLEEEEERKRNRKIANPIDAPEIQEKIRELIKLAKEQGYLTFDDINDALPNDIVDQQDYEVIMDRLRSMAFDIIDASNVDSYTDRTHINTEEDDEEEKLKAKMDSPDDYARMYLKQKGQVVLQTREQEVPMEEASFSFLKEKIKDALNTLTDLEREVMERRFGLKDGSLRILEEVGRQFSVTRERIRQIEAKALRELHHPHEHQQD